jgi:hypothetical protein
MEVVNEKDPSNYESIQRVNGRGGGSYVKGKEMINDLLGLLANGREKAARNLVYIFFSFLNRTDLVRFGLAGLGTPKLKIKPDIFLNILISSINFFYWFSFSD